MVYHEETDTYTCANGKELQFSYTKKERSKTGYERETQVYSCQECDGCPHKKECIKRNRSKKPLKERSKALYVSRWFVEYRKEDLKRIISEVGCELRMNRSIQAEGSFGDLKPDSGFRRFLCRGTVNVKTEDILLALAHNMRKLHNKIQADRTGTYLFPLKKARKIES